MRQYLSARDSSVSQHTALRSAPLSLYPNPPSCRCPITLSHHFCACPSNCLTDLLKLILWAYYVGGPIYSISVTVTSFNNAGLIRMDFAVFTFWPFCWLTVVRVLATSVDSQEFTVFHLRSAQIGSVLGINAEFSFYM